MSNLDRVFKPLRSYRGWESESIGIHCECGVRLPYGRAVEEGWLSTADRQLPVLYKCKQCEQLREGGLED